MKSLLFKYLSYNNKIQNTLYLAVILFGALSILGDFTPYINGSIFFLFLLITFGLIIAWEALKKWLKYVDKKNEKNLVSAWEMISKREYDKASQKLRNTECLDHYKHRKIFLDALIDYYKSEFQNSLGKLEGIEKPDLLSDPFLASFYQYKGYNLEYLKRYNEAVDVLTKAIELKNEISPNDFIIYQHRGACYYNLKEYAKAISDCDKSTQLKPEAYTYNNKALALLFTNQYQSALDNFNRAIELNNENSLFYCNRMQLHIQMKNWDGVINDAEFLLSRNERTDIAYFHRGIALLELSKAEKSIEDFNKAYSLGYNKNQVYYFKCLAKCKMGIMKECLKDFKLIEDEELKIKAQKQIEKYKNNLFN